MDLSRLASFLKRKTKTYDASKNTIDVAGLVLDGVFTAKLSPSGSSRVETGVDPLYYTVVGQPIVYTFNVTILPLSTCVDKLKELHDFSIKGGYTFKIKIVENGKIVGEFDSHFLQQPDTVLELEAPNKEFQFGCLPSDQMLKSIYPDQAEFYDETEVIVTPLGEPPPPIIVTPLPT